MSVGNRALDGSDRFDGNAATSSISSLSKPMRLSAGRPTPSSSTAMPLSRCRMSMETTSPPTEPMRLATAPSAPGRSAR